MSRVAPPPAGAGREFPRWLVYVVVLGVYLSLRGYHSMDSDQCYRLPLLLHQQDPSLYANDPFVRAFDTFNPHRGSLIALNAATRPFGLSAGLFFIFILTFTTTCLAIDRLAAAVWPESAPRVGLVAVGLFLTAKAGNIGTNHLFEAMVLDRLMAFALGWQALAAMVADPNRHRWRPLTAITLATVIHPSVGLQLAFVLSASWVAWSLLGLWTKVNMAMALHGIIGLVFSVLPGLALNISSGSPLQGDMPSDVFWLLSVELQSPQHMLPHLWRMPQWLAWGCYLVLAALALTRPPQSFWRSNVQSSSAALDSCSRWPAPRVRLVAVLVVVVVGLAAAWCAIERLHVGRVTVFQPFRMATIVRGIALVLLADRVQALWCRRNNLGRVRAVLLAVALIGDWLLVVVSLAELAVSAVEAIRPRLRAGNRMRFLEPLVLSIMLALGLNFLGHHDTEYGNRTLFAGLAFALGFGAIAYLKTKGARRAPSLALNDLASFRAGEGPSELDGAAAGQEPRLPRIVQKHLGAPSGYADEKEVSHGLRKEGQNTKALAAAVALAWVIPLAALLAAMLPINHAASRHPLVNALISRCRFTAVPADDIERLGVWCREHTPPAARFIGPPGPKTFRLWSRRSLAFNRAASPYHAAGLADWFARFQDHVAFHGSPAEFVRSYVGNRHGFEARYHALSDAELAALALRQGATYVVATAPSTRDQGASRQARPSGPLELLHVEGRYAVYRVDSELLAQRQR